MQSVKHLWQEHRKLRAAHQVVRQNELLQRNQSVQILESGNAVAGEIQSRQACQRMQVFDLGNICTDTQL